MGGVESSKRYWETVGAGYDRGWEHPAMRALADRELGFVRLRIDHARPRSVLDIGIGNGRVIDTVLQCPSVEAVYGVDIAEEMVDVCRARFAGERRVKELRVCDLSAEGLPFGQQFDFATAIRVLKYNPDWRQLLSAVAGRLTPGGHLLFSMPNRNSLNRYSRYPIPSYAATGEEIVEACRRSGLRVLEMTSFSKIPSRLYRLSTSLRYGDLLLRTERALEAVMGTQRFGRELLVVAATSPGVS